MSVLTKAKGVELEEIDIVSGADVKSIFRRQQGKLNIKFPHDLLGKDYASWLHNMSSGQREEAGERLDVLSSGNFAVMPRICTGLATCPMSHVCPFALNLPLKLQCPVEQRVVMDKMNGLLEELNTDSYQKTEFMLINRVVELELLDFRVTSALAGPAYQDMMVETITGSTNTGDFIKNEVLNPFFELKERISREKMKLLAVLVRTPQEKYKKKAALKEVTGDTYATKIANMNKKLMDLDTKMGRALEA